VNFSFGARGLSLSMLAGWLALRFSQTQWVGIFSFKDLFVLSLGPRSRAPFNKEGKSEDGDEVERNFKANAR
jgi:hypothetical protein